MLYQQSQLQTICYPWGVSYHYIHNLVITPRLRPRAIRTVRIKDDVNIGPSTIWL